MSERRWDLVGLPILRAIGDNEPVADCRVVAELTGLDPETVRQSVLRLEKARYIAGNEGDLSHRGPGDIRLDERGLQAVGEWPAPKADLGAALIAALDELAAAVADPDEKTRIQVAAAEALG